MSSQRHYLFASSCRTLCLYGIALPVIAFSQSAPDETGDVLTEIIVTARKVEERVQDVPMSIQVLSAGLLEQIDVTRLYELQFNIPGLIVNNLGKNGAGFSLRGVADQGGTSQSIATHLNGVHAGNATLSIARLFDVERVEILKGPQGTLYGRNSTGGSINFVTRAPAAEFGAGMEAAYGSFQTVRAHGHLDLPIGSAATRLAFVGSNGDGYIRNSVDDRVFAESDFWGLRASVRLQPGDNLIVDLMAQRVRDDGASGELWSPRPDFLPDRSDIRLTTVTLPNPYLVTESDNVSLTVEYDFGALAFRSITGYARTEVQDLDDCAGTPVLRDCVRASDPSHYDQLSQELQLASTGDAAVDWLAGVYFFDSDYWVNDYLLSPVRNPLPLSDGMNTSDETVYAAFGQGTMQISDHWRITAGLRLNRERNRVSTIGTGVNDSPNLLVGEDEWDNETWRVDLQYAPTDEMLIYAGVSTGFKSGAFVPRMLPTGELDGFDSETLIAYEAGIKSQWPERGLMLNAAAFYYDFDDMQVSTVIVTDDVLIFETDNAAKAEILGFDLEGSARLSDRFSVSGGVVWLPEREFVDFRNDETGDTLSGNKLSRAPEWSVSSAISYLHSFADLGSLSARLEYNHRSEYFFSKENDAFMVQENFGLLNFFLEFESRSEAWRLFASARNLGNTDYYNQVLLQSSPGYPDTFEAGFGYRF